MRRGYSKPYLDSNFSQSSSQRDCVFYKIISPKVWSFFGRHDAKFLCVVYHQLFLQRIKRLTVSWRWRPPAPNIRNGKSFLSRQTTFASFFHLVMKGFLQIAACFWQQHLERVMVRVGAFACAERVFKRIFMGIEVAYGYGRNLDGKAVFDSFTTCCFSTYSFRKLKESRGERFAALVSLQTFTQPKRS